MTTSVRAAAAVFVLSSVSRSFHFKQTTARTEFLYSCCTVPVSLIGRPSSRLLDHAVGKICIRPFTTVDVALVIDVVPAIFFLLWKFAFCLFR